MEGAQTEAARLNVLDELLQPVFLKQDCHCWDGEPQIESTPWPPHPKEKTTTMPHAGFLGWLDWDRATIKARD